MIEGKVLRVRESWPLELDVEVEVGNEERSFTLAEQATIVDRGEAADPGRIKPGQKIRLTTDEDNASIATEIQIID